MGTAEDRQGRGGSAHPSPAPEGPGSQDRLSVEVADDLTVSVDAGVEPDAADDASDVEEDDETAELGDDAAADTSGPAADTSGPAADAPAADADEPPSDAPLGLTSVRLPVRGRRRGRSGTIF